MAAVMISRISSLLPIRHPNCVQFMGIHRDAQKKIWLIYEKINGRNLSEFLREHQPTLMDVLKW
jgi:hypothetical protein